MLLFLQQQTCLVAEEKKKKQLHPQVTPTWCLKCAQSAFRLCPVGSVGRGGAGRQVTQIKLNLTKHALNGYYLLARTFNFNKPNSGWGPLVNCCCCRGPPVTNFDYETWQLLFFLLFLSSSSSSKLAASRNETTPKALLIFVPHKTQPPDGRKLPPLCARLQPVHFGRGRAGRGGGRVLGWGG